MQQGPWTREGDMLRPDLHAGPGFGMPEAVRPSHRALPWLLVVLVSSALGAVVGRGLIRDQDQRRELTAIRDETAELRRMRLRAHDQVAAKERALAAAAAERTDMQQALVKRSAESEANERIIAKLRAELDAKDGDVSSTAGGITVNLVDRILFKSGDATLSPRGKQVLDKMGRVIKTIGDRQIMIGGHTDDRPIHNEQYPSNWELSAARAVNVVHYLTETVGVEARRIAAAAYSEFHPRARDRAKNRRIEILLAPPVKIER